MTKLIQPFFFITIVFFGHRVFNLQTPTAFYPYYYFYLFKNNTR